DGIRDRTVTGVQTCALPISMLSYARGHVHVGELVIDIAAEGALVALPTVALLGAYLRAADDEVARDALALLATLDGVAVLPLGQIGRASWRERVESSGVSGA